MRIFIAALAPSELKCAIAEYVGEIKPLWKGIKWEHPDKIHLTLKFLGEVGQPALDGVIKLVGDGAAGEKPFEMETGSLSGFPELDRPRVVFLGLSANSALLGFHKRLERGLSQLGFPKEERRFKPHLTLGRAAGAKRPAGNIPTPPRIKFQIERIAVMKSKLCPHGSIYTLISGFALGGGSEAR
ncbi:MAG: RNA 2',3'-cyclic phosphodiesterase [Deltaproteobacteria bacterium]